MNRARRVIKRWIDRIGWNHSPVRRVLFFTLAGPIVTLVLGLVGHQREMADTLILAGFHLFLAAGLYAVIRPASYERSTWRCVFGMLWLLIPLVVLASTSFPADALLLGPAEWQMPDLSVQAIAMTSWLGVGFASCAIGAVLSVLPLRKKTSARKWMGINLPANAGPYFRAGVVLAVIGVTFQGAIMGWMMLSLLTAVPRSHISGNVPRASRFDGLMHRDLEAYFASQGPAPRAVTYELLRRSPTQSGLSYPKYYAWVRARSRTGFMHQGAARLAAIDGNRFEVTDFISSYDILADPDRVERTFPHALHDELVRRAEIASHTP